MCHGFLCIVKRVCWKAKSRRQLGFAGRRLKTRRPAPNASYFFGMHLSNAQREKTRDDRGQKQRPNFSRKHAEPKGCEMVHPLTSHSDRIGQMAQQISSSLSNPIRAR